MIINRETLSASLNGGYIEEYEFDIQRNLFTMRVDILDHGARSSHDVRFEKISHFAVDSESRRDKERLELTEVWINTPPESSESEEWSITISMWDLTHIHIRCALISIDGATLR